MTGDPMTDAEIREALTRAERAYDELMRVTGMGKYAKRVQGGPPNPPRCSIPARPDYDTDLLIGESLEDSKRLAADLLAARAERDELHGRLTAAVDRVIEIKTWHGKALEERDEARAALATPTLAKHQPCGCVVCTCGDVERCGGCGARMCDSHRDDRSSLANDPATVWEAHPLLARAESAEKERDEARAAWKLTVERPTKEELRSALARAETAEARCRELEAERAIVADYLRDTDADFRARRPSERAVLDALLSPPPPHTCQIHRATSGASDCGLSPCEEAKVHTDRGASRRAQATPVEDMTRAQVQAELAARGIDVAPAVAKVMDALGRTRECACPDPRCAQHGSAPAPCSSCVGDGTVGDIVATIAATVPGKHVSSLHGSQEITALRAEVDRLHTQRGDDAQQLIDFAATLAIAEEDVAWDALRARVAALEAVERAARSEIAYMDETKAAHPDALVEPTLSELRAALARLDRP